MSASTSVHIAVKTPGSCGESACRLFEAAGMVAIDLDVVLLVLCVGLLASSTAVHLSRARSLLDDEYTRVKSERVAFEEFATQVRQVESTANVQPRAMHNGLGTADHDHSEPVKRAYKETVMAVSHYEEDYDETLGVNMSRELGDETRRMLEESDITPILKRQLVTRARAAAQSRAAFLSTLEKEREALSEAADFYGTVVDAVDSLETLSLSRQSVSELASVWQRLRELEANCESRLERRQRQLHRTKIEHDSRGTDLLPEYLYAPLEVSYPVLHEVLELVKGIRFVRTHVTEEIYAPA